MVVVNDSNPGKGLYRKVVKFDVQFIYLQYFQQKQGAHTHTQRQPILWGITAACAIWSRLVYPKGCRSCSLAGCFLIDCNKVFLNMLQQGQDQMNDPTWPNMWVKWPTIHGSQIIWMMLLLIPLSADVWFFSCCGLVGFWSTCHHLSNHGSHGVPTLGSEVGDTPQFHTSRVQVCYPLVI